MGVASDGWREATGMPSFRERLLERAVEAAENGIVIADAVQPGYPILYSNPAFTRITGYRPDEVSLGLAAVLAPDMEHAEALEQIEACIGDATDCTILFKGKRKDGRPFWSEFTVSPMPGPDGLITHLVGVQNDITDRVQSERALTEARDESETKVKDRTAALERINADLEGFTYSVSHDLRAPLRAIMGFSKVLVEDHGRAVDDEMRQTLDRINAAALRMSGIIDDLLTFSRLGRKELVRQPVNLSEIAEAVGADLVRRYPDRDTLIGVDRGIVVEGDPTLLRMAVENLIDNAYKFTSKKEHGKVEFRRLGDHKFVVKDNGAGFDARYADKLFRPFERLHPSSEYPGTGIGLANVRRIIERHGGRVWAEGKPEKGASFYFEL